MRCNVMLFRCYADESGLGRVGPPCTTVKKDNFYMELVFNHTGIEEGQLIQTAGATASKGEAGQKLSDLNI